MSVELPYVTIVEALAIVAVSGGLIAALSRLLQSVLRRVGARPSAIRASRDILRVTWIVVAAVAVIPLFDLASVATVLTVSGFVGLAVSLALQTVLSNMIAGLLLWREGAVRIGDDIEYGGVKGTVVRVALRNTWVRSASGDVAIIGNSALANGPLINRTASPRFAAEFRADEVARPPSP